MRHTPHRLPRNDDIHLFSATSTSNRQNDPILDAKLKKRETDRLAQRACRQRQKDRIAYLETLVRELRDGRRSDTETSRSPNEGTCVRSGPKRKTTQQQQPPKRYNPRQNDEEMMSESHAPYQRVIAENASSRGHVYTQDLDTISVTFPQPDGLSDMTNNPHQGPNLSDGFLDFLSGDNLDKTSPSSGSDSVTSPPPDRVFSRYRSHEDSEENNHIELCPNPILYPTSDPLYNLLNFDPADLFWPGYKSQYSKPFLQPPRRLTDREKWHSTDDVYKSAITACRDLSKGRDIGLSCLPLAAVIQGWDTLDEKDRTHPVWASLHWVEESVFGKWQSNAQRIAMMYLKHRLMLFLSSPTKRNLERVPAFMRPRPSQETIQHPVLVDFLLWPSLRDRLVFTHQIYSTGAFSRAYSTCLRFKWPSSDADILIYDQISQTWGISELFERYACDLSSWTMTGDFFDGFMEMSLDIPSKRERSITV